MIDGLSFVFNAAVPYVAAFFAFVATYWVIPAGAVALYYYGWFHFNSPDYQMEIRPASAAQHSAPPRLIALAPPIYTIPRSRFRRYAFRYIIVLETAFVAIVLLTTLLTDTGKVLDLELPDLSAESVQYRAIWALFALTGLLSSFPGLRDIDRWLLQRLHSAAIIPDDARLLADRLFDCNFDPAEQTKAEVRKGLAMRDTRRVADGTAKGILETKILQALWLKYQLHGAVSSGRYSHFRLKMEKDLEDISEAARTLEDTIIKTLGNQEALVPGTEPDIDHFIRANSSDKKIAALASDRKASIVSVDMLYYRMCLIAALFGYSAANRPDHFGPALRDLGFEVTVFARPIVDWDAIARVSAAILAFSTAYLFLLQLVLSRISPSLGAAVTPKWILFLVLFSTGMVAVTMFLAIKVKRFVRKRQEISAKRQENIVVASVCYIVSVVAFASVLYAIFGRILLDPVILAIDVAITAYFIGIYIDRSLSNEPISYRLALLQGTLAFVGGLVAAFLTRPDLPDPSLTGTQEAVLALMDASQSALGAFLIGVTFQYFYRRAQPKRPQGAETCSSWSATLPSRVDSEIQRHQRRPRLKAGCYRASSKGWPNPSSSATVTPLPPSALWNAA